MDRSKNRLNLNTRLQKKGQITIFIIIGLIIILSAAIVIYMVQTSQQVNPEEALIPQEAKPIYDYVTNCMNVLGQEALNVMGNQGGYLNLPNRISRTPSSYVPLDPSAMLKVPYWHYQAENRIPTMSQMQRDVDEYVQEKLLFCTQEFADFSDQYTITQDNAPLASTLFTDEDVTIKVTWPLDVKLNSAERSVAIQEFVTQIPVRYKKVYNLARQIMITENSDTFFENLTIDLMSAHSDIPFDGFEFSCRQKKWKLNEIETIAQEMLRQSVAQIRIKNTVYPPFLEEESVYEELRERREELQAELEAAQDLEELNAIEWPSEEGAPADRYAYFHYLWDIGAPESNLKVHFSYTPTWDMHLNAHPNSNGILRSNAISQFPGLLKLLCINQYHFTYDVIYPVLVSVHDDESYNDQGYSFRFAFPVLVHYNKPNRETFSDQQFVDYSLGTDFCEELGSEYYSLKAIGYDEFGYQDELTDVNVTYDCLGHTCELGTITAIAGENKLFTQLPSACGNPFIIMEKEGYIESRAQLTQNSLTLEMTKLRSLDLDFVKMPYQYRGESDQGFLPRENFKTQDKILLYMRHLNSDYELFLEYPSDDNNTQIQIIDDDADYEVDVMLMQLGNIVGGYHDDNLSIKYQDLSRAQGLTFHLLESRPIAPDIPLYQQRLVDQVYSGAHNDILHPLYN